MWGRARKVRGGKVLEYGLDYPSGHLGAIVRFSFSQLSRSLNANYLVIGVVFYLH